MLPFVLIAGLAIAIAVLDSKGFFHSHTATPTPVVTQNEEPAPTETKVSPVIPATQEEVKAKAEVKKEEKPAPAVTPPPPKVSPWETIAFEDFEKIDLTKLPPDRLLGAVPSALSIVKDPQHGNVLRAANPNTDSYGMHFVINLDPKSIQGKTIRISTLGRFPGSFTPMPGHMNMSPRLSLELQQVIGANLYPFIRLEPNNPNWQRLTLVRTIPLLTKAVHVGVGNHYAAAETFFDDVRVEVLKGSGEIILSQNFNAFDLNKPTPPWEMSDKNTDGQYALEDDAVRGKVLLLNQTKQGDSVALEHVCNPKTLGGHVVILSAALKMKNAFTPTAGKPWACPRVMLLGKRGGRDWYGALIEMKTPSPDWTTFKEVAQIPNDLESLRVSIRIDDVVASFLVDEVKLEVLPN